MGNEIYTTFMMLLLIVGVLGVVLFFVKKFAKKAQKKISGGVELQVVSRIALQQKSHLCIVKADKRLLLIGVTDNNISILSDLTDDPKAKNFAKTTAGDLAKLQGENTPIKESLENDLSFKSFLKQAFGRQKN
jgi:flagellar biogenesis protein FliO